MFDIKDVEGCQCTFELISTPISMFFLPFHPRTRCTKLDSSFFKEWACIFSLIARKIPVPLEKQINFSTAILVCKQFLKGKIRSAQIFEILSKHLSPIRPGRQYKRYQNPVSAVAFQYRFS